MSHRLSQRTSWTFSRSSSPTDDFVDARGKSVQSLHPLVLANLGGLNRSSGAFLIALRINPMSRLLNTACPSSGRINMFWILFLGYLPGLVLPLILLLFPGDATAVWFYMVVWVVYLFGLLVYVYFRGRGGRGGE